MNKKEILKIIRNKTGQCLPQDTKFKKEGNYNNATLPSGEVVYFTKDWRVSTGKPKKCLGFISELGGTLMRFVRSDKKSRIYTSNLQYFSDWGYYSKVEITMSGKIILTSVERFSFKFERE